MARRRNTSLDSYISIEVRNMDAIVTNFQSSNERLHREARKAVKRSGDRIVESVRATVHVVSGRMQRLVKSKISPDGLAHQTGWFFEDFRAEAQPFYPAVEEPKHPSLYPSYMIEEPKFKSELSDILRQFGRRGRG